MSHIKGFVVKLNADITEEQADELVTALSMFRGAVSVKPLGADSDNLAAREWVAWQWSEKLLALIREMER